VVYDERAAHRDKAVSAVVRLRYERRLMADVALATHNRHLLVAVRALSRRRLPQRVPFEDGAGEGEEIIVNAM
jgi:hypothetical protein